MDTFDVPTPNSCTAKREEFQLQLAPPVSGNRIPIFASTGWKKTARRGIIISGVEPLKSDRSNKDGVDNGAANLVFVTPMATEMLRLTSRRISTAIRSNQCVFSNPFVLEDNWLSRRVLDDSGNNHLAGATNNK
jgi:hypothetical protein